MRDHSPTALKHAFQLAASLCFFSGLLFASPAKSETIATINAKTGGFKLQYETVPIIETSFAFWRAQWSWFNLPILGKALQKPLSYSFSSRPISNKFTLTGLIESQSENAVTYKIKASEAPDGLHDIFGGISFKISLHALKRENFDPKPEIMPNKMGWSLLIEPDKPPLTVTFNKPVQSLEFEQGNSGNIRALLLSRNKHRDNVDIQMTISFPGKLKRAPTQNLAKRNQTWWPNDLHWNKAPVDLSFLNAAEKPAGKRGFLRTNGENLVFEDGTQARFWGTNLSAYAIFQYNSPELVRHQAKRLSKLGFNLVRLHHHDSHWVNPNIFKRNAQTTRLLNETSLERLHWWVKCLKDEGIYVWIDLHVGRQVTRKDSITAFEEISKGKPRANIQGYAYINPSIQERMKEFAKAFLTKVNPHTGLALKDDPAIATILITNENDLTHHFGNSLLPDKNVPWHNKRYMALAKKFANTHGLDYEQTWRSWEHGPSKLFLSELEHRFFKDMTDHLRQIGAKVPIITTNFWGKMSLSGLPSMASSDMIDVHAYGSANELMNNPRFNPNLASWIATADVAGRPLSVSEWNVQSFPAFDRYTLPPHLSAIASLQGWDSMLLYAYAQAPMTGPNSPSNWQALNDPAMIAMLPVAALLFRDRHVTESRNTHYLAFPQETFIGSSISPDSSRAIRTLTERSKLRIAIPAMKSLHWSQPTQPPKNATIITDPNYDAVGPGKIEICSDTNEICRNWKHGWITINTPKSQIAAGWIGGKTVNLQDVSITLKTENAAIAVQSLEDKPITKAQRILISITAQALPNIPSRLPFYAQPLIGELKIKAQPNMNLYRLDREGKKQKILVKRQDGWYTIQLSQKIKSNWLLLEAFASNN